MNFNFSYILQQPFRLLWKHKRLALLNLPGSLAGAGLMALFPLIFILPFFAETGAFFRVLDDPWPIFSLAIGGPFVLFLITMPVSIFTSTALIKGVATLEKGEDPGGLGGLLRSARPFFWRVAGLTGLQTLAGFLVAALPGILILITVGVALICLGPLMPLLTPLSFVLGLMGILAMHILIIEDVGVIEAIKMAWQVFKKTWRASFWDWFLWSPRWRCSPFLSRSRAVIRKMRRSLQGGLAWWLCFCSSPFSSSA
jgi:hypothetical protein